MNVKSRRNVDGEKTMYGWHLKGEEPEKGGNKEYEGLMGIKADKLKLSLCLSPDVITIIREKSSGSDPALSPSTHFSAFK